MRGRNEVKTAIDRLCKELEHDLKGLDESSLIEDLLAEKDQTIAELRAALKAQSVVLEQVQGLNQRLRGSIAVKVLRKLGALKLVKKSVLRIDERR